MPEVDDTFEWNSKLGEFLIREGVMDVALLTQLKEAIAYDGATTVSAHGD